MTENGNFTMYWPIEEVRRHDLYFHQIPIEQELPDFRMRIAGHGNMIMLGSYSYLGLNGHPRITQAAREALEQYGTGTHGARLLAGTLAIHQQLEARIARFKKTESALTFTSGFITNISTISALVGRHDTVICDKLNHASIVDGCMFSQAKLSRFQHNDMGHLEKLLTDAPRSGRKLVIVDAVFSMDGDIINLPEVSRLCRKYDALLMVDEAHAIGVLGQTGHGLEEHFNLPPDTIDIKMGTLSKAIPSVGGYIAGSERLCDFLKHQARGWIYSGSLPPAAAAAALAALDVIEEEPERVQRLRDNVRFFRKSLRQAGFPVLETGTAICPVIVGDDWKAWEFARYCTKRGIYVQAIPHPVVPKGMARLRAAVSAAHRREDLAYCVSVLQEGARACGVLEPQENVESAVAD
jgi:8-amino-7-oxononanoate synthase